MVPFWLVDATADGESANMTCCYREMTLGGITARIPLLKNSVALHAGDVLRWNKDEVPRKEIAKAKAQPSKVEPPPKKAKAR